METTKAPTDQIDRARSVIDALPRGVHVDGRWSDAATGATLPVEDPATGETLTEIADGGREDAMRALQVAAARQHDWARTPPRERGEVLRRAYELMTERAEDLALVMTSEMGKPLAESRGEVAYAAEFFRWFAEEAVRVQGDLRVSPDGASYLMELRKPVGPVVLVTPWNFPLAMGTRKIGPALAAGCTVVLKPARLTPLSTFALVEVLRDAGLPDGVVNVVCGSSAGEIVTPWMESGLARKVSFTGSTPVGVGLLEQAAQHVMRSSMELGGNAPFVVCSDADVDAAVDGLMIAKMRNMGEACTAANRVYVHDSLHDAFAEALTARMSALVVGDGRADGVDVGPLVEAKARDKVAALVDQARSAGAQVRCGGEALDGPGHFYAPTVLTGVTPDMGVAREEIFGPVAPLMTFGDDDEAIRLANDTDLGLMSYVFTQDMQRAMRYAEALEAGMVGLGTGLVSNPAAPFGGVKESGLGREGGRAGIEEYLEITYLAMPRP